MAKIGDIVLDPVKLSDELLCRLSIKRIEAVKVKPEDRIIITVPNPLPVKVYDDIRDLAQNCFPGNKVLVLADGITLSVNRTEGGE